MRVVLDINVLVSGLLWLGSSHKILELAEKKKIDICLTSSIFEELRQVLDRPKFLSRIKSCQTSIKELITGLYKIVLLFPNTNIPGIVKEDPDDDKIIACAEISGAKYIITGDSHLLNIKQYHSIFIVTPTKFLSL